MADGYPGSEHSAEGGIGAGRAWPIRLDGYGPARIRPM